VRKKAKTNEKKTQEEKSGRYLPSLGNISQCYYLDWFGLE
jgi:hypothetical protein